MEDLIGKKVKGFKFEGDYVPQMDRHIGEVGKIISVNLKKTSVRVAFNKTSWKYPVDQIEKHLVKKLPKSFGCTNTNQKLWNKYISWLNKEYTWDFLGNSSHCPCYGIDKNGEVNNYFSKQNFDTIISLEEWDEIVNGTQIKELMKTGKEIEKLYLTDKVMYIGNAFSSLSYGTYYNLIREFDNDYLVFDNYGNEIAIPKKDFADEVTISKIRAEQKERAKGYMMLKDGYRLKEEALDDVQKDNHYDNSNGSLYLFAQQHELNAYEFDIIKRIVRCRKKGYFHEDLAKSIRVIELYLKEHVL